MNRTFLYIQVQVLYRQNVSFFGGVNTQEWGVKIACKWMLNIIQHGQTVSQSWCTILHSCTNVWALTMASCFYQHLIIVSILNLKLIFTWGLVVSHCDFNLYFPNDRRCWVSFSVFDDHLYIFYGEVSVTFFNSFI